MSGVLVLQGSKSSITLAKLWERLRRFFSLTFAVVYERYFAVSCMIMFSVYDTVISFADPKFNMTFYKYESEVNKIMFKNRVVCDMTNSIE
jgi:hypothetical protein